ncbi:phosphatidate cytidylyltransferase [Hymenobacter agri]
MSRLYIPPTLADSTPSTTAEAAAAPAGPSNLRLRITYGLIGAALLLGSVWFSPWTFGLFFAFVQAVMLWEFYRMMRAGGYAPATWIGIASGLIIFCLLHLSAANIEYNSIIDELSDSGVSFSTHYSPEQHLAIVSHIPQVAEYKAALSEVSFTFAVLILVVLLGYTVVAFLREIVKWKGSGQPTVNVGVGLTGLFYVAIPMGLLSFLAFDKAAYDYRRIFALLFLIWASDIGAYAAGKTFGKHKMAPKISPGKTWEGWAGGFVLTLVVGWAVGFMLPDMPLAHRLVAAGVVAVFAPHGDLAESMLKRSVGVKDSGSIMPGHGGLLDRFDAFLLVLPVLALLQLLAG